MSPFTSVRWGQTPHHDCSPHHLNHCMLQDQPGLDCSAPPHPRISARGQPSFTGHSRKLPGMLLGTVLLCSNVVSPRLLLNYPFPAVTVKFSVSPLTDHPAWPGLPAWGLPSSTPHHAFRAHLAADFC